MMLAMSKSNTPAPALSLTQRIHQVYNDLPTGERKAADRVLDMPGELALWSASELAEHVGVSNATISRFVRRLGYGSYDDARREARAMRAVGSPLYLAESCDADAQSLSQTLVVETELLNTSFSQLNPLVIRELSNHLATAPRVRLAGFRNSYIAAEYGRSILSQFRPDVEMLNAPGQTLAEGIAGVAAGDVVLLVGLRRVPKGFRQFISTIADTGADIALIADPSIRKPPEEVRWNLACAVATPQILDSYAGTFSILRKLALATLDNLGAVGRRHLAHIEAIHESLEELK